MSAATESAGYPGAAADERWRRLVFPPDWRNPEPRGRYDLVVIGAGPAGLVTAIAAAGLGARVALIERHAMGGDCLNVGCVPSKALLAAASSGIGFDAAFAHLRAVRASIAEHDSVERYAQAGVEVFLGEGCFEDARRVRIGAQRLQGRRIVIATGARPAIPPLPGLEAIAPLTNESVFELRSRPRRLAILGAGPIGCELAQAFARLGSAVELVEQAPRVLPAEEPEAAALVAAALAREGVRLHLGVRAERARRAGGARLLELAGGVSIEADEVLVAAGRQRNLEGLGLERAGVRLAAGGAIAVDARLRTSQRHIFAAGDVCSPLQFTHAADAHARIVVRNALFGGRARADRLVVPRCTYTRPEVAQVGATSAELARAERAFERFRIDFGDLDRGRTDPDGGGFAEMLTARGSDRLLGATIAGRDAGEQLAPLLVLMNAGLGLGALGSLVLPYPTRSEYLRRLADAWSRTRLTPRTARVLRWWLACRR